MSVTIWMQLAIGLALMIVVMTGMWAAQRRYGDAGIVDVAWAFGVGALAVGFAAAGEGDTARRSVIAGIAALWAVRLGSYLARRVARHPEDGRYQELRERWGPRAQRYLFAFFQAQATWTVLFALPMLIASQDPTPLGAWRDYLAVGIWLVAVGGESVADRQMARYRAQPANRGGVCREGLWRYSRHPNYFFEWLHWWAYVALGWGAAYGWLTLLGPALMLIFLLKVTGIPPTEARALATRGEAYRRYQRTTSAFFPWPPKKEEDAQ